MNKSKVNKKKLINSSEEKTIFIPIHLLKSEMCLNDLSDSNKKISLIYPYENGNIYYYK